LARSARSTAAVMAAHSVAQLPGLMKALMNARVVDRSSVLVWSDLRRAEAISLYWIAFLSTMDSRRERRSEVEEMFTLRSLQPYENLFGC